MTSLHIDLETFSTIDLKKAGSARYAEEAEILLFGYAWDDKPAECIDITKEKLPYELYQALRDPEVKKKAFNAAFERAIFQNYYNIILPVNQWECTQARVAMCGLPLNLEQSGWILGVQQQKDKIGGSLIRQFCVPVKTPNKRNDFRARNLPEHDPENWQRFIEYCKKDVEAERAISKALSFYQISAFEHRVWQMDQTINERGVGIHVPFVQAAIKHIDYYEAKLMQEAREITGIANPKSVAQLKRWLFEETDEVVEKLNKETIPAILAKTDSKAVRRVLEIRQESSKTSIKKYPRMLVTMCRDQRIRGVHHYYGANRTGRDAARLIQTHNMVRGGFYRDVRSMWKRIIECSPEWFEFAYEATPLVLSDLLRSAIIPAPGKRYLISDFSAIEAVKGAWLAGEEWVLDVFRTHCRFYEATAARMFNLDLSTISKGSPIRQKGKVAALALQYAGGVGALITMGALKEGLTEEELDPIKIAWRKANPNIVRYWACLQSAAMTAVKTGNRIRLKDVIWEDNYGEFYSPPDRGVEFYTLGRSLFLKLPSGRELVYVNAGVGPGKYGEVVTYFGIDQKTGKWGKQDTYGGKIFENICQASARDLLMSGITNLEDAGYPVVLHVHDEVVCELPVGVGTMEEVNRLMATLPAWAAGLPLKAEGEESFYYKK